MKILVCVKQVPDTNEVRINKETGTLIRDGVPSILNPDDANALEEALKIKDEHDDVTITVITMGPPQADFMLRECLAMGADDAILLSDRAFGGADTWATSNTIAAGISKVSTPVLLTAVKELNTPRYMSVDKIVKAYKHDVKVWTIDDLDVNKEEVGLKASPTKVFRSFTPEPRGKGEILEGKADEIASKIIIGLKQKHII